MSFGLFDVIPRKKSLYIALLCAEPVFSAPNPPTPRAKLDCILESHKIIILVRRLNEQARKEIMIKNEHALHSRFLENTAVGTGGGAAAAHLSEAPMSARSAEAVKPAGIAPDGISNPYPSCEDLSDVATAVNGLCGEISFVFEPITDFAATKNIDVLICGQGPSGMAAALACAEKGLHVVAVEKGAEPTLRSATMGGFNDRIHKKYGVVFDMRQWLDDAMVNCLYRGSQEIYQKLVDTCDEAVNWYFDKLALNDDDYVLTFCAGDFPDFRAAYDELSLGRSWNTSINIPLLPEEVAAILQKRIAEAGGKVLFNTPVVQLVSENGKIAGAVVKTADGYVKYQTAKGVVLATGGYEFNPVKLNACCRPRDLALSGCLNTTKMTNTGDGHEMAKAVGAMEDEYPHPVMIDPQQLMPYLRVNKLGRRFVAEYSAYNHLSNAIQSQPGACCYYIVDTDCAKIVDKIWTPSSGCYAPREEWIASATGDKALKADTLEELAKKMDVPADTFAATIKRWNKMCDAGEDADFHFPGRMMRRIDAAPFYATKEMAEMLSTSGGLQITPNSEVLDAYSKPIPGFYAIGNVSGSMISVSYPHNLNCLSHCRCVTFGYNLAKTLAAP